MKGMSMLRGYNNSSRMVRDRFLRSKKQFFGVDVLQFPTVLESRMMASTPCSLGMEKNFFSRCKRYSNDHRFFHQTITSRKWNPSKSIIRPFTQRLVSGTVNRHTTLSRNFSTQDDALVSFSSVSETPLDSTVMEKPYTVILMEDDVSDSFFHFDCDITDAENTISSWDEDFRSRIPRDYGMSFCSISLQLKQSSISKALEALKASQLTSISDAILVARGPCSSLLAQYYLESFSLKGLVVIDPILLQEQEETEESKLLYSLVSEIYSDDLDSLERFHSLKVEPNAVPMMVVRTISDDSKHLSAWKSSSLHVAERHGDPDGPYGSVPVLDRSNDESEAFCHDLLEHINNWIDEEL